MWFAIIITVTKFQITIKKNSLVQMDRRKFSKYELKEAFFFLKSKIELKLKKKIKAGY